MSRAEKAQRRQELKALLKQLTPQVDRINAATLWPGAEKLERQLRQQLSDALRELLTLDG